MSGHAERLRQVCREHGAGDRPPPRSHPAGLPAAPTRRSQPSVLFVKPDRNRGIPPGSSSRRSDRWQTPVAHPTSTPPRQTIGSDIQPVWRQAEYVYRRPAPPLPPTLGTSHLAPRTSHPSPRSHLAPLPGFHRLGAAVQGSVMYGTARPRRHHGLGVRLAASPAHVRVRDRAEYRGSDRRWRRFHQSHDVS